MSRVVVLGSINVDYVAIAPSLPGRGETVSNGRFFKAGGGKGANQAVAVSRLGAECVLIGALGGDVEGDAAVKDLEANRVDVTHVSRKETHSGVALIFVEESTGENEIVVAPGANGRVSMHDVEQAGPALSEADVLLAQLEIPPETVRKGLMTAAELGVTTLLNPAPAVKPAKLSEMLEHVDYISPNRSELEMLTGETDPETGARRLLDEGMKGVFVTLGAEGALLVTSSGTLRRDAFKVKAVDTVGAGDAFNGALAVGLAEKMAPSDLLRFATAAGAVAVMKEGARPSQPFRKEVEKLLERA